MEDSLMEHTDAILNLLNKATHKGNLSSGHLVQRLEYLKHRLDDFLCLKTSGLSTKPSKPGPMKQQTDDTGVLYECGICNSPITMYNGDHKLSMDLHCQEEVHQRALSKANDKPVPEVNDKHVSLVKGGTKYHCSLCNIYISKNMKCVQEHLKGYFHKTNLKTAKNKSTPVEWKVHGKYFVKNEDGTLLCKLCTVTVKNATNEIMNHVHSKKHTSKYVLSSKQEEPQVKDDSLALPKELCPQMSNFEAAKDSWSKLPDEWKIHRKYFVQNEDGTLHCKLCPATVKNVSNELLDHLRSKKHTSKCAQSSKQEEPQVKDAWSALPKELQPQKPLFLSCQSGAFLCKVCGVNVPCASNTLLDHICGNKHTKRMDAFMGVNGDENGTRCSLCDVTTSKNNMSEHVLGIDHQQKLQQQRQDYVWSLIPEAYKQHRNYFMTDESGAMQCMLCDTHVAQNHTQVLEHICGKKHNSIHIFEKCYLCVP